MLKRPSSQQLFFSLLLISLGVLLTLHNVGLIHTALWKLFIDLWPLVFVLTGTRLVVRDNRLFDVLQVLTFLVLWIFIYLQIVDIEGLHYIVEITKQFFKGFLS